MSCLVISMIQKEPIENMAVIMNMFAFFIIIIC